MHSGAGASPNDLCIGEVYVKFTKKSGANYANEESYQVYSRIQNPGS